MQKLYADRIAQLADPSSLDELPADSDIEGFGPRVTMATPVTSASRWCGARRSASPGTVASGLPRSPRGMTERVPEMQAKASKAPIFIALGIVAIGGIGGVAYFTATKQPVEQPAVPLPKDIETARTRPTP